MMIDNGPYGIWAETETTVEFNHCDPMRVVWHGNYLNYFEIGRRTLLEKIGYDYNEMEKSGYAFPVVEIKAKYLNSLKFKDSIKIKAVLAEYENRIKIDYVILNCKNMEIAAKGTSIQMAINMSTEESCFICPKIFIDKVEELVRSNKQ